MMVRKDQEEDEGIMAMGGGSPNHGGGRGGTGRGAWELHTVKRNTASSSNDKEEKKRKISGDEGGREGQKRGARTKGKVSNPDSPKRYFSENFGFWESSLFHSNLTNLVGGWTAGRDSKLTGRCHSVLPPSERPVVVRSCSQSTLPLYLQ